MYFRNWYETGEIYSKAWLDVIKTPHYSMAFLRKLTRRYQNSNVNYSILEFFIEHYS